MSDCGHGWGSGECGKCRAARLNRQRAERETADRDWFARTGGTHCGGCGEPISWCQCPETRPCGCRELHPMGSGIGVDPADVFAETPVSDDQAGLFDV